MFEVGFTEILVISVLALVVLGPEKLPRVAAQIGRWVGRARSMARQFREQLEEEVQVAETNKTKAKESARAEADVSAAQGAAAPSAAAAASTTTPGADAPYGNDTQHMYTGVTGEDPHSAAMATDASTATPGTTAAMATDASETAHSDNNGPPAEPEAAEYQPPAYAHAGANGTPSQETAGAESSTPQPSPVKSQYAHDDDDPPRKPGDFITHTHERGI
jgi:sec-independent protein translocase protein TatB